MTAAICVKLVLIEKGSTQMNENNNDYGRVGDYDLSENEREAFDAIDPEGTFLELTDRIERMDARLEEIDKVLNPQSITGLVKKRVSVQRKSFLTQEKHNLLDLKSDAETILRQAAKNNKQVVENFITDRDRVIAESEDILITLNDVGTQIDRTAKELNNLLTQRRQIIESLAPLITEDQARRYLSKDKITEAMGKAGLRDHAEIGGSNERDHNRLADHDSQIIANGVRMEVLRLKNIENQKAN
jgi:hypothetical protein